MQRLAPGKYLWEAMRVISGGCLKLGFMAAMFASHMSAAEADALLISSNIQANHIPFGTVVDPFFADAQSAEILGYTRCADSAIWTGHYLAAEAFRYAVTQSSDALANVRQAVAGIKSLVDVTGTNVLARCLVPVNSPYAANIQAAESIHRIYWNNSAECFWVGNTSRDQYVGVMFGLAVAFDVVSDTDLKNSIKDIVTRLVSSLRGHGWNVEMPDGVISTTFLIRPDQILTFMQIAKHVNPSKFSMLYYLDRLVLSASVIAPIAVDAANDSSYFKFNLDYISLYNLVRLESGVFKSVYKTAYDVLRSATSRDQNAMFNLIDRALNGEDPAQDDESADMIEQWLQRPRRNLSVDLSNQVTVCGDQACEPIPVPIRVPDEYIWQVTPYQLSGGGAGTIENSGVDYILPYWMARYYGIVPGGEAQPN